MPLYKVKFKRSGKIFYRWWECENEEQARQKTIRAKYPVVQEWKELKDPVTNFIFNVRRVYMNKHDYIFEVQGQANVKGLIFSDLA